ncbi:MAG TPA: amidohydrolase [Phycisphaerae bacterium]|nr:amidohydrolase [Phycisphaerae bacterium]
MITRHMRRTAGVAAALLVILLGLAVVPAPAQESPTGQENPPAQDTPPTQDGEGAFPKNLPPTMIIVNGQVWTGIPNAPEQEAIAITKNRITAVGTSQEIAALANNLTRVIDAGGRRVIPGITDSHTHIIGTGLQLQRIYVRNARNRQEFVELITAAVTKLSPGQWLLGGRYSVDSWEDPSPPCKEWIDPVTQGVPVFLSRMDGHQGLANSMALKFAGIDRNGPPDPPGGEIVRNPDTNEPTGVLKDAAMELVQKRIPVEDKNARLWALQLAMQSMNAWGITSVHDMSDPDDLPIFMTAHQKDALSVRIRSYVQTMDFKNMLPTMQAIIPMTDDRFRIAGFKAYMDGSLGSRTAWMKRPYTDAEPGAKNPRGLRSAHASDLEAFAADIRWAHDRNLQMAVHAIGDQANHEILDIYESLPSAGERRHRIEHCQHLLPEDIKRFADIGVIASMQPYHKADDGRYAETAIGPTRAQTSYAFKDLIQSGAVVCFGSDTPVVPANPFAAIMTARRGETLDGDVWIPEQRISLEQALFCYTVSPTYAAFMEDRLGTIQVGKLADIAILNTDILNASADQVPQTESVMTIMDGKIVWQSPQSTP